MSLEIFEENVKSLYLQYGFDTEDRDWFEVRIISRYKDKTVIVKDFTGSLIEHVDTFDRVGGKGETLDSAYKEVLKRLRIEFNKISSPTHESYVPGIPDDEIFNPYDKNY